MGGGVAEFADKVHAPQEVVVHHVPEFVRAHETDQLVVPGRHQLAVHGVHPLDGEFHCPAAVQHAGRRVNIQDLLCRDCHLRERGELWFGEEYVKVGHGDLLLNKSLGRMIVSFCLIQSIFASSCQIRSVFHQGTSEWQIWICRSVRRRLQTAVVA